MERKPEVVTGFYEVIFPKHEQQSLIQGSVDLVNHFSKRGLMLPTTNQKYTHLSEESSLVVAVSGFGEVIGTAAYTQFYERNIWEFGGWAVAENFQHSGIGMKLINKLFKEVPHAKTIAFGNKNSGPIFESLGAKVIKDHSSLPMKAFELCANCPSKPKVGCCDTVYNLAPAIVAVVSADLSPRQIDGLIYGLGENQWSPLEGWEKDPKYWK